MYKKFLNFIFKIKKVVKMMVVIRKKISELFTVYLFQTLLLSLQFYSYIIVKWFFFTSRIVFNCMNGRQCCHHHLSGLSNVDINGDDRFTTITSESVKFPDHRYLSLDWNLYHDFPLASHSRRRLLKKRHVMYVTREETSNLNIRGKEFYKWQNDWWLCLKRE